MLKNGCMAVASLITLTLALSAFAERLPAISADPYLGAVVTDAATGEVLAEDQGDREGYPASMVKLMVLLLVQEKVEEGVLKLDDPVKVSATAAGMGGSQVYLAEKEVFPVEELLYADFYLPAARVYVECWDDEEPPERLTLKLRKKDVYREQDLRLVEINARDADRLDEVLGRPLMSYGIRV